MSKDSKRNNPLDHLKQQLERWEKEGYDVFKLRANWHKELYEKKPLRNKSIVISSIVVCLIIIAIGTALGVYYGIFYEKTPPAPIITYPGSSSGGSQAGPILETLTPTLQWNPGSGADLYRVTIFHRGFGTVLNAESVGTTYTVPSGVLQYGQEYFWYVQAHNSAGYGDSSNDLFFQTEVR